MLFARLLAYVEVLQLVTLTGVLDVDDIILNVFGAMIGYMVGNVSRKLRVVRKTRYTVHS